MRLILEGITPKTSTMRFLTAIIKQLKLELIKSHVLHTRKRILIVLLTKGDQIAHMAPVCCHF